MRYLSYEQRVNIGFEYVLSLLAASSPYGAERVRRLRVYGPEERAELECELENVGRAVRTLDMLHDEYAKIDRHMMLLKDVRKSITRTADGALSELELFEIKRLLLQLALIAPLFERINAEAGFDGIEINALPEALAVLDMDGAKAATFFINDARTPALLASRKGKRAVEQKLREAQTEKEREALMAERSAFAAREDEEERRIRAELSKELSAYAEDMLRSIDGIGRFDFTVARARLAAARGGVMPAITEEHLAFSDMTNPRIEDAQAKKGADFTPVSISLSRGAAVITGANMGGKSVALKTVALNALLTLSGVWPFAGEANVPMLHGIYMVSEDLENVERGLSSFGAEIVRFNEVEEERQGFSLMLLDEFARGTNPFEGAAIVRAVTEYLDGENVIALLTTHYDGVADKASAHYQVLGLRDMDVEQVARELSANGKNGVETIASHMNYGLFRITEEEKCPRDALNICRLLGLKDDILKNINETD